MKLVTPNGKYHGDVEDIVQAIAIAKKSNYEQARVLSDQDWEQVLANPDRRAELFGKLGQAI